jgi:hypothetical protein
MEAGSSLSFSFFFGVLSRGTKMFANLRVLDSLCVWKIFAIILVAREKKNRRCSDNYKEWSGRFNKFPNPPRTKEKAEYTSVPFIIMTHTMTEQVVYRVDRHGYLEAES